MQRIASEGADYSKRHVARADADSAMAIFGPSKTDAPDDRGIDNRQPL